MPVKALLFDVFGTVVDWHGSIARELEAALAPRGVAADWAELARGWRALYQPAMEPVRSGRRGYVTLDVLHRENLDRLLDDHAIDVLSEAERADLNRAWHRLSPWPDSPPGMTRLRRRFILASLSNGNVALMVGLIRTGGLPFDAILGAEFTKSYKPAPQTYLGSAAALGLAPADCMMVAAHNDDLAAAKALGFATAFVRRPDEHGPGRTADPEPTSDWTHAAESMEDLADRLGA